MGFHPSGFPRVQDGAALGRALVQLHVGNSRLAPLGRDVGHRGVVLLALLAQLRQLLELWGRDVPLEGGDGRADAVHPLLLVEHVVGLQRVRLARAGLLETHAENVFGCREKGKSASSSELALRDCILFEIPTKSPNPKMFSNPSPMGCADWIRTCGWL